MKHLLCILLFFIANFCSAQYVQRGNDPWNITTQEYVTNSPTNTVGNRRNVTQMKDSTYWWGMYRAVRYQHLNYSGTERNDLAYVVVTDDSGYIYRAYLDALLDTSTTLASKTWVNTRGFLTSQANADWNAVSGVAQILNKPFLSTVATTGAYADLTGKPTIPAAQVNADWNAVSGVAQILNKPSLSTVATTGAYTDLTGKPTLSTVATTGAYADLTGKPTIPAAQVNTDWNAVSGVAQILNKPTLSTVATTGAYADLTGKPTLSTVATTGAYADLTGKPTIPAAQVNADWSAVSGVAQILNKPTLTNGTVTSIGVSSTDFSITGSPITSSGTIVANLNTSGVSAGTYDVVTVNSKGIVTGGTNSGGLTAVTRPINGTTYTTSSTRPSTGKYYIKITCTATIGSASTGTVNLQYSTDGGTNWNFAGEVTNSNTVTLAVALNSVTIQTGLLSWDFPTNALVRMNSSSSGTTTITYVGGGERPL